MLNFPVCLNRCCIIYQN